MINADFVLFSQIFKTTTALATTIMTQLISINTDVTSNTNDSKPFSLLVFVFCVLKNYFLFYLDDAVFFCFLFFTVITH